MGNTFSTNFTNTVSDIMSETVINISQECGSSTSTTQSINISNISGDGCDVIINGIDQTATINVNLKCISENDINAKFKKDLSEKLAQVAKNESGPIPLGNSSSVNMTNSISKFVDNLDISSISKCIASVNIAQEIDLNNISCRNSANKGKISITNINQVIVTNILANCLKKDKIAIQAIAEIEKELKQTAEAKNGQFMAIGGSGSSSSCLVSCAVIALLVFSSGALKGGSGGGGGGSMGGGGGGNPKMQLLKMLLDSKS